MSSTFRTYTSRSATRNAAPSILSDLPPSQKEFAQGQFQLLNADLYQLERDLRKTFESVCNLAKSCVEYDTNDAGLLKCSTFIQLGDQVLTHLKAHEPTLAAIKQKMINAPYESPEALAEDYESNLTRFTTSAESNERAASEYSQRLQRMMETTASQLPTAQVDEEISVVRDVNPADLQCPITGTYIQHLLVSRDCGHAYEKDAVLEYFNTARRTQRIECLYSGCPKYVSRSSLVEDPDLERRMRNNRRLRERESENHYETI